MVTPLIPPHMSSVKVIITKYISLLNCICLLLQFGFDQITNNLCCCIRDEARIVTIDDNEKSWTGEIDFVQCDCWQRALVKCIRIDLHIVKT